MHLSASVDKNKTTAYCVIQESITETDLNILLAVTAPLLFLLSSLWFQHRVPMWVFAYAV